VNYGRGPGKKASLALLLFIFLPFHALAAKDLSISFREPARLKINRQSFNLNTDGGIASCAAFAEKALADLPPEQTPVAKRDARALKAIVRLSSFYATEQSAERRDELRRDLIEIASAMANNHRPPILPYVDPILVPFRLIDAMSNPVAKGAKPAANLQPHAADADLSTIDPLPSTYWQKPTDIASHDLRAGFGREALPDYAQRRWEYAGPKLNGRNPGCELISGDQRIKVKFAETHSEPFTSRIFSALGYHVDATDYAPQLTIKYDPRIFSEFNLRPPMKMRAGLLFIPLCTFNFQKRYDPFVFIKEAHFRDGHVVTGAEFKQALARDRAKTESEIDFLITVPANVQSDHHQLHSIGPWGFDGLGRENLREVRAAGILAGWLGWWDSRFENTKLRVVKTENGVELQHVFTDLGGGLGRSSGTFDHSCEKPGDFGWTFTRRVGKNPSRFEVKGYHPIQDTLAFERMTLDDARWMVRLIAQLSEPQIVDALRASGFGEDEVSIYTQKLLSRRSQLLSDLEMDRK